MFIYLVPCTPLTKPDNGTISCSLGGDGVASYEDICRFTCNTGYSLIGSDTRTCQSNKSWSGSDVTCKEGKFYTKIVTTNLVRHNYDLYVWYSSAARY